MRSVQHQLICDGVALSLSLGVGELGVARGAINHESAIVVHHHLLPLVVLVLESGEGGVDFLKTNARRRE